jgi:hypothetical protein
MWWFSKPTTVDDFVTYFLRPMKEMDAMPQQQELVQLFTRGYGLSSESWRERKEIAQRLVRSLKNRNTLKFATRRIQDAKARFFNAADAVLTPSEMEQAETWFRGLEHKYCSPADKIASLIIDQWKQACQCADETSVTEPHENAKMPEMQSPETPSDIPLTQNVAACRTAGEMYETVEKQQPDLSGLDIGSVLLSERIVENKALLDPSASRRAGDNEVEPSAVVSPVSTSDHRQSSLTETSAETANITLIEATGMDDAVWKEVERQCAISMAAWNDTVAVQKTLASFASLLASKALPGLLFDEFRQSDPKQKVFAVDVTSEDREIWFLGDIHSDLLALESALAYLKRRPMPVSIVLLGDLFDDGPLGAETVLRVMRLILDDPSSVTLIAGNHDEALEFSPDFGEFRATVSPCEFSEWLNAPVQQTNSLARKLGELTIDLVSRSPRALFFRDGLLAAHGGIPLPDVWDSLSTAGDLNDPICLQDFVWSRPHHRRKRTIPNRSKKGAGLGYEDFSAFCELAERLFGFPVRWMIRGHDHVDTVERFASYDAYQRHPLLTINTLCYRLYRENLGAYVHAPCIAKYVPGKLPEIHCVRVPEKLVRRVYPDPTSGT